MTALHPRVTLTEAERYDLMGHIGAWKWESRGLAACESDFMAAVERIIAARLAPIRALADEWADLDGETVSVEGLTALTVTNRRGRELLAALDAPVSDHDGAEGQGDGGGLCGAGGMCELPAGHDDPDTHRYWPRWNVKAQ